MCRRRLPRRSASSVATAGENHPTDGIRMVLERDTVASDSAAATYVATIYTPEQAFSYRAELSRDGTAVLALIAEPKAPDDFEKRLLNLAKSTARSSERKASDGLEPWPPRIARWRAG